MNNNYFLALMLRPGDYKLIDLSKLDLINNYSLPGLVGIDYFTMNFTEEEIIDSIKRANIVDEKYLHGNLVILQKGKRKPMQVLCKNFINGFNISFFFESFINNKSLINNVIYKLSTLTDDKIVIENLKLCYKVKDINTMLNIILKLDYTIQRKFMIYLIDLNNKELNKLQNEHEKTLELIDDKAA